MRLQRLVVLRPYSRTSVQYSHRKVLHRNGPASTYVAKATWSEWHLDKAHNFLGETFASARVGSGSEDDLA